LAKGLKDENIAQGLKRGEKYQRYRCHSGVYYPVSLLETRKAPQKGVGQIGVHFTNPEKEEK